MKTSHASLAFLSLVVFVACSGSDGTNGAAGAPGPAGPAGPAGSSGANGKDAPVPDAGSPPAHAPAGITFFDTDDAHGEVAGTIVVKHATNESDVTSYAVYFGKSATEKLYLTPIFVAPADGADVSYPLVMNPIPAGATNLLAVAQNAAGESAIVATALDRGPFYVPVAAGGAGSGQVPSLAIDAANGKVLVATLDGSNSGKPSLFRCNLDGTSCTQTDISAGAGTESGLDPSLAIDATNGKVLVATDDYTGDKPTLFRCNLDGTSCTQIDISAGAAPGSGEKPSLAIDVANGKLLVVTEDVTNNHKPSLFRCNLDGTSCTYTDISAGAATYSGFSPSLAIDAANGKLLVATEDGSNNEAPGLFRCNLDGTSCTYTSILAGANSGENPSLAIDAANGKLLVVTQDESNSGKPSLFRCNLDGTSCTHTDISAGAAAESGDNPSLAIDAVNGKLLVAADDAPNSDKPGLFCCNLDGTSCTHTDIAGAAGVVSGGTPSLAIDAANGNVFIATQDGSNNNHVGLFLID